MNSTANPQREGIVLDYLLKYWPLVTVAALALVSVFNVGYFGVIGMHFIGVMDLTNII
jgi:hypothetical protein